MFATWEISGRWRQMKNEKDSLWASEMAQKGLVAWQCIDSPLVSREQRSTKSSFGLIRKISVPSPSRAVSVMGLDHVQLACHWMDDG